MKVVTWNIAFGQNADVASLELLEIESLAGADIVLLQEMDLISTRHIADELGANYGFAAAAVHRRSGRDFGNAIVSRWPITEVSETSLPHTAPFGGQPRSATSAVVCMNGVDVLAYSVHTEVPLLRLERRREQFSGVARDAWARATEVGGIGPVVVGGDFNTVTGRAVRRLVGTMHAADLRRVSQGCGSTMNRFGRGLTLDHIFARHLAVTGCGVATEAGASDHQPLWVTLDPI